MQKRILVVEDEETLRSMLVDSLKEKNYLVEEATNGEIGLDLAVKNSYDLILLDIILPKKNGLEVLEDLKKIKKDSLPKVIVLTNLSEADSIQKALDLGAMSYLVKADYNLREIVMKVKNLLEA